MRFLHTADWHLGRTLGGFSLREDQEHIFGIEFPRLVAETRPDAVLLAGDVFDRAVPPAEAVELLDDILQRIVLGLRVPVIMIPGNHDDPRRLAFGSRLLAGAGLHIGDSPLGRAVTLRDAEGEVAIVAVAYASPLALAQQVGEAAFADHDAAFAWLRPQLRALCGDAPRRVLVAHGFVTGGSESESERALSVGGTGQIGAGHFADFDYVALGHLHRPQALASGRIRYAGSPLAYSTSEADQDKSMLLVELEAGGAPRVETVALTPKRRLVSLTGSFATLAAAEAHRGDFVAITLTDPQPVPEAQRQLARRYERIISFDNAAAEAPRVPTAPVAVRSLSPLDLFAQFHASTTGRPLDEAARAVVAEAIAAAGEVAD